MPSHEPNLKNIIGARNWASIVDSWLKSIPVFTHPGARPDPGLENLATLQQISLPSDRQRFPDVAGLRQNMLSESVFMFHKCAHAHLAAQRVGATGMHSWCIFNAYHSAFLGARGILGLLGIGLPYLSNGGQIIIDLFPAPESSKGRRQLASGAYTFDEFLLVRIRGKGLEQSQLWKAFRRAINVASVPCWEGRAYQEVLSLPDEVTKPRNAFLYKAAFWPGDDLLTDGNAEQLAELAEADPLNIEQRGFLLRLSFNVYWLFSRLIGDLADASGTIQHEIAASRIMNAPDAAELDCYNSFVAGF
jgi:hypothetical protein